MNEYWCQLEIVQLGVTKATVYGLLLRKLFKNIVLPKKLNVVSGDFFNGDIVTISWLRKSKRPPEYINQHNLGLTCLLLNRRGIMVKYMGVPVQDKAVV